MIADELAHAGMNLEHRRGGDDQPAATSKHALHTLVRRAIVERERASSQYTPSSTLSADMLE